jgi:hypothetical protein
VGHQESSVVKELRCVGTSLDSTFHIDDDTFFTADGFLHLHVVLGATRLSNLEEKSPKDYSEKWLGLRIPHLIGVAVDNAKRLGLQPDLSATCDATHAFSIEPGGKLFVFLAWKGRLTLWTGRLPKVRKTFDLDQPPIRWDAEIPELKVATEIKNERFFAYQDKRHWYFVTDSGKVHRLARDGEHSATECIWKDTKRPVRMLVEDNATGKTWAFAPRKDRSDKKLPDVYFPLAKKIEPVEYDSTKLPAWDLGKPLAMALAHARFLLKEKKVSIEDKKVKPPEKK